MDFLLRAALDMDQTHKRLIYNLLYLFVGVGPRMSSRMSGTPNDPNEMPNARRMHRMQMPRMRLNLEPVISVKSCLLRIEGFENSLFRSGTI